MIDEKAMAIARAQAAIDRDTLARLVAMGKVQRADGEYERTHPEVARPFVADIKRRVDALVGPRVNLAIRPKSKRRRR